jgi:quinol monooxygenase YgiN
VGSRNNSQEAAMAGFVQIVEFQTSRIEEVQALVDERRPQMEAGSTVRRLTATADRDRPGYYFTIIEFDSYEAAMENSNRPETSEFSAAMGKLCDGPAKFYNLDVWQTW